MLRPPYSAFAIAAGFATVLSAASTARAESGTVTTPETCNSTIDQRLSDLKVNRADLDKISIFPRYENRDDQTNRVLGFDAWVRFKGCTGALVIDLERDCRVRQVYTRGQCRVPGVKAF